MVIGGMVVGLIAILALPAVGFAVAALQGTDEPPRQLTPGDLAPIGSHAAPAAQASGPVFDPYSSPGTVLARGTNTQPSGSSQLLTYVLEEVTIPAGVQIGGRAAGPTVVRLTVLGGPFTVGAISPVLWIDDTRLQSVRTSPDLLSLSVLVPDRAVLRNGAVISVSYGVSPETRERLPEPLTLGASSP
jgi:hypothetical protein